MNSINSPMQKIRYNNFDFYIKRDDLLSHEFSGNKARKFYYFLKKDFKNIKKIISFGSAQANSLYSLSCLAKLKNVKLDFYVKHIASHLEKNPSGNYEAALLNNANIIKKDFANIQEYIEHNILKSEKDYVFIEEGGRVKEAEFGVKILALEIEEYILKNNIKNCKIMLPSGTGTTALFLQKNLKNNEVLTCACVGDENYLKQQFSLLEKDKTYHPTVLQREKKYHFGKLYKEFYEVYQDILKQTNIEFDLLYDPLGLLSLSAYLKEYKKEEKPNIIYIHQGGLLGNKSMQERYERKFL